MTETIMKDCSQSYFFSGVIMTLYSIQTKTKKQEKKEGGHETF